MKDSEKNGISDPEDLYIKSDYNLEIRDFSLAVRTAISDNNEFRKLIKTESLKMFDGDYDILLSNIVDKKIEPVTEDQKSVDKDFNVRDLLENCYNSSRTTSGLKDSKSIIDDLITKYPYLQISVPVNAEKWNDETYIPVITFLPEEYNDLTTSELTGYTSEGKTIAVDAVTLPEEPVIVISMNERISLIIDPVGIITPPNPYNLTGTLTESGIRITWQMPDTTDSNNTDGYYVYRKSASDATYLKISTISGSYNRSYDDNNVESAKVYSYFVVSYNDSEVSYPSNYLTMTAPLFPNPVTSFDAIQNAKYEIELRWQNDNSQYIKETRLYKYVVGITSGYQLLHSFSSVQHDYFDRDITPGKKIIYKVTHVTSLGESNPRYDFVQAPFRDVSQESPVYIKKIKFTDWRIERWPAGKPEFYITVSNVDPVNKSPFKVQDQINCEFSSRSSTSQTFYGVKVLGWQPGFWYDMLTFTAVEYDRPSGELKLKIGVGYNLKDSTKIGTLKTSGSAEYIITFQDKGEECGNSYIDYFDSPETWLEFPNYGVKILISETDK
jgi:hypothetical protein